MHTGIYVHVPFCLRRCTYCDFNTYTGLLELEDAYVAALVYEIELRAERAADIEAQTLYFGGGTPSLLGEDAIAKVVQAVRRHFRLPLRAEITVEANPGTLDALYIGDLMDTGITRLSLGVQSSSKDDLELLGRIHTWEDVVAGVAQAREVGLPDVSLDLIFGLPGQTMASWQSTVEHTLALEPDHLSLYALQLEPGTPLAEAVALGELPLPDQDLAADMYESASAKLHVAGFWQYEISNWARGSTPPPGVWALPPGGTTEGIGSHISRHNLIYWRNQSWIGLGAGAHSWFRGRRFSNYPHPRVYTNAMRSGRLRGFEDTAIDRTVEMSETMMMGLRLAEGVTAARFGAAFGVPLEQVYGPTIEEFDAIGLISWDGERVRLTERGRLLGNQVFEAFLLDGGEL